MISIAVLITCHNRRQKTIDCLISLFENNAEFNIDIFLVDDGSTDGTSIAVSQLFPSVHIIEGDGELYWNRGMIVAWKYAMSISDYDFYLWLNDDVKLRRSALELLVETSSGNSIIVGSTRDENNGELSYGGRDRDGNLIDPNGIAVECQLMNGNIVLVPSEVIKEIGILDPVFTHALGDFDYVLRAKQAGIKILIASEICGFCESHSKPPLWCRKEVPLVSRIMNLYSPLGNSHPRLYFIYIARHFGFVKAVKGFLSIHLRLLFPTLWYAK